MPNGFFAKIPVNGPSLAYLQLQIPKCPLDLTANFPYFENDQNVNIIAFKMYLECKYKSLINVFVWVCVWANVAIYVCLCIPVVEYFEILI